MCLIDVHRRNLRKKHKSRAHSRQPSRKSVGANSLATHTHSIGRLNENLASQINFYLYFFPAGAEVPEGSLGMVPVAEMAILNSPSSQHRSINEMERKLSFTDQDDMMPPVALLSHQRSFTYDDLIDIKNKPELTIFSEEGIADMDLPDHLFIDELEYLDNITSCNKVENCVMLSEYEQNLIKETESPTPGSGPRRGRRWSLFRQASNLNSEGSPDLNMTIGVGGVRQSSFSTLGEGISGVRRKNSFKNQREIPIFPNTAAWNSRLQMPNATGQKRSITVIDEASV